MSITHLLHLFTYLTFCSLSSRDHQDLHSFPTRRSSDLALYLRKNILELSTVLQSMQEAEQLMKSNAYEVNSTQVLRLVHNSGCSSYDCEFVALADDLDVQLVSFDRQICREFSEIAVRSEERRVGKYARL